MKKSGLQVNRPVRRKLLVGSMAYLAGIYAAQAVCFSEGIIYILCALLLCAASYQLRHRKRALPFMLCLLFLMGNGLAGHELSIRDEATNPGVMITGTVTKLESDTRVYLSDVTIDGTYTLKRPAVVTLMQEEDSEGNLLGEIPSVRVGQQITGTGRLFEQDQKRNPGGIDWRIQALCKGYDLSGYILPGWQVEGEERFSISELTRQMRLALSKRIDMLFGEQAPLFRAVIIGDKSDIDDELIKAMQLTGIVHILTISGMHMSLMAQMMHMMFSKLRVRKWHRFMIQAILLGAYAGLTGGAVGTIRAYIMALIREFAALQGRKYEPITALGAAALLMTLVCPLWALSASFQFSFFVVLGILLLNKQLSGLAEENARMPLLLRRGVRAIAFSASAQLAALPMQLMYYGYIPVLSIPMNLLSGLFMPAIMLGGWGVLGMSLFFHRGSLMLAKALSTLAGMLERFSVSAATLPWGIVRLPAPYAVTLLLALVLMFAASLQVYVGKHRRRYCSLLLLMISVLYLPRLNPEFSYVQLDVGQGDGALLRKDRSAVLIDVGPADEYAMLRYLRHEGLFADLVILTHADEDHAGALGTLLDSEVSIKRIALPVGALDEETSEEVQTALEKARAMGVNLEFYEKGDKVQSDGFTLNVLSPDETHRGSNERSLVLYTEAEGVRILTLGDLPDKCEMDVVPPCDVLKVAHHGSRYATSRELIEQAQPEVAIISVGRNSYGHPTDRVLEDLADVGAEVLRTDLSGCVTIQADQEGTKVIPYIKQQNKKEIQN